MLTEKIRELAATKARIAKLEDSVAVDLKNELRSLPLKYGFQNADAFLRAVVQACRGRSRGLIGGRKRLTRAGLQNRRPRRRVKITDGMRADVKQLVEAGKSGIEVAKIVGVSLPSVQKIKKAWGLVKDRKQAA